MAFSGLILDGTTILGVYGFQVHGDKYDHMYLLFEGGKLILLKTMEFLIEGGEVYELTISEEKTLRGLRRLFF